MRADDPVKLFVVHLSTLLCKLDLFRGLQNNFTMTKWSRLHKIIGNFVFKYFYRGVSILNIFSLSLMLWQDKLECLSKKYFQPGLKFATNAVAYTISDEPQGAPYCQSQALLRNIREHRK